MKKWVIVTIVLVIIALLLYLIIPNLLISLKCKSYSEDKKWECYRDIAIDKKSPRVCEKLQDSLEKENCYYFYATRNEILDLSSCDKIQTQDLKDKCYGSIAGIKNDETLCNNVLNQTLKELCIKLSRE